MVPFFRFVADNQFCTYLFNLINGVFTRNGDNMISRHSSVITLTILIGLVAFGGGNAEKEIPMTKFSQNVGGPTMTFLYW